MHGPSAAHLPSLLFRLIRSLSALMMIFFTIATVFPIVLIVKVVKSYWKSEDARRLLIFPAFFPSNAGYRWRVAAWTDLLKTAGWTVQEAFLWSEENFRRKVGTVDDLFAARMITKRCFQLIRNALRFDVILVRRQMTAHYDIGFHLPERILNLLYGRRILDFDDDIAAAKQEPLKPSFFGKMLGFSQRPFTDSLKYYNGFIVGNMVLRDKLLSVRSDLNVDNDVLVLPTCFEVIPEIQKTYFAESKMLVIGWLGSTGNQYVLNDLIEELNAFYTRVKFTLKVVSGRDYVHPEAKFPIINRSWSLETEKLEMLGFDIGIMPLSGRSHEAGKSGFKLIQYMSVGLVTVASDVGINTEIAKKGAHGFLVGPGPHSWEKALLSCMAARAKWPEMGEAARAHISQHYSHHALAPALFRFLGSKLHQ